MGSLVCRRLRLLWLWLSPVKIKSPNNHGKMELPYLPHVINNTQLFLVLKINYFIILPSLYYLYVGKSKLEDFCSNKKMEMQGTCSMPISIILMWYIPTINWFQLLLKICYDTEFILCIFSLVIKITIYFLVFKHWKCIIS